MEFWYYILAGAGVGLAVGLTGVGGGSLMTPLLIFSGVPEKIAIGTDLLYAAITKTGGAFAHNRQGTIDWKLVTLLASGSIPASLLTSYALFLNGSNNYGELLTQALGVMLILTASVILFKQPLSRLSQQSSQTSSQVTFLTRHKQTVTFCAGAVLGVLVTLSSVGAGAFCAVLLLTLYPKLPAIKVVGTDIAHAVPLTLIGGLGHMLLLGNVDFKLLAGLLIGSLPAVQIGTHYANRIPNKILQPILASLLIAIGLKFLFF